MSPKTRDGRKKQSEGEAKKTNEALKRKKRDTTRKKSAAARKKSAAAKKRKQGGGYDGASLSNLTSLFFSGSSTRSPSHRIEEDDEEIGSSNRDTSTSYVAKSTPQKESEKEGEEGEKEVEEEVEESAKEDGEGEEHV